MHRNPEPRSRYDLVVIGAGTAGLVSAAGAAGLGARVALVERARMGGECLNTGCVPSKALLASARAAHDARHAHELGVDTGRVTVDFGRVMARLRALRDRLAVHDSVERFTGLGVDVFLGQACFRSASELLVDATPLAFDRAIIATGSRPTVPSLPWLASASYLTTDDVWDLSDLPARLTILGGGAIGCELAQAFARLGSQVTLFERGPRLLEHDEPEAGDRLAQVLAREGVRVRTGTGLEAPPEGETLLIAAGRSPNVEGLGLEQVGVHFDIKTGIEVDDHLRTTAPGIFAAGDVCSRAKFTHLADAHARIAVENALFWPRARVSRLAVPWCTYTDPEIAHIGKSARELAGRSFRTLTRELATNDRAVLEGTTEGFLMVHVEAGKVLGATLMARHAGEAIGQLAELLASGRPLNAQAMQPYPTQGALIRQMADELQGARLTPLVRWLAKLWFRRPRLRGMFSGRK